LVQELALPDGVVIALVARGERLIPPQGRTRIEPGDHVIVVLRPDVRRLVDRLFADGNPDNGLPVQTEFPLRASASVGELEDLYDLRLNLPATLSLDEAVRQLSGGRPPRIDDVFRFQDIALRVREMSPEGRIVSVGMIILPPPGDGPSGGASPVEGKSAPNAR
jgi:cell volume regulation protein A